MEKAGSSEPTGSKRGAILCLSLSMLLGSLGTSIANIALPTVALAFETSFSQVQWVVIAYLASLTILVIFAGRLGDRFGRRRMLVWGLVLFSLASLLCGLATGLPMLIAARAIQGIGAAFLMTLTIALVRETVGSERTGRAMGLLGTMSAVGTALGPSLGGALIGWQGWPMIFLVLAPAGLLTAGLALWFLPTAETAGKVPGSWLSGARVRGILPGLAANILVANLMMTTLITGPFYLGFALGLREAIIGLVMSIGPVIAIITGVPAGRLVDARGAGKVLSFGLFALIAGSLSLAFMPGMMGLAGYIAAIAILTSGYQMFQAANNTMVMAKVSAERRGEISGLLALSRNLGLILGASVMGSIFSLGVGSSAISEADPVAIADGMRLVFVIAGASIIIVFRFVRRLPAPGH